MTIEIRPAVPSDAAQILTFITELAEYEKARHEVISNFLPAPPPRCSGLMYRSSRYRQLLPSHVE